MTRARLLLALSGLFCEAGAVLQRVATCFFERADRHLPPPAPSAPPRIDFDRLPLLRDHWMPLTPEQAQDLEVAAVRDALLCRLGKWRERTGRA